MGGKKRPSSSSTDEVEVDVEAEKEATATTDDSNALNTVGEPQKKNMKPMERRKKRKSLDKERHHHNDPVDVDNKAAAEVSKLPMALNDAPLPSPSTSMSMSSLPAFHINVFRDLADADSSVRKAAAENLASELIEVQRAYERMGGGKKGADEVKGAVQLEAAEKDDGLENCAPSLRYAIRRLIRGVSSSRECARQGFALGLSIVLAKIPAINVESLMKLIVNLLEVSASMKGQEAKDCLLGRLFAYGSLARSGRLTVEWSKDMDTSSIKDFVSYVMSLAGKRRYLREPAISILLDMVEKLPLEAVTNHVLEVSAIKECFQKGADVGDPDALFLALKLRERVPMDGEIFGKLLPCPFIRDNFFTRDHLQYLSPCFKESTFCHPRVHSLWQLLVDILVPVLPSQGEAASCAHSGKKHKKNRKDGSFEEMTKNIRNFCEVVIEESLLLSSHVRKHLALMIILLLLPRLPASCVPIVLSYKLVQCLMDILSTKGSNLYEMALYFMKELVNWIGNDDDRRVSVIVALQKHSSGRFDCITKIHTVKEIGKFVTVQGCLLFVHNLMSLFVDDGVLADEPSDQSQTTDENSEICSVEDKDSPEESGNTDTLKNWIVDTMPRVLKNLKLDSNAKSWADTEIVKFLEEKVRVQAEIMKFLAVQGLFSASLGTEVTSFELQEKFKWPKAAISSSLCRMCIEQLQLLLEDAQKGEVSNIISSGHERSDLGSYFMCFLKTLCNIPSVSLYRSLSEKDQEAFKKLQETESRLLQEERKVGSGLEANKLHALRYVLIQLVLQVLLCPEEFYEAASELVICCQKAFPSTAAGQGDSLEEENEFDDNEMPDLMDVLLETFLSLLPQSSGPMCFAIEQDFRLFCDDLTTDGILRMLHVVRKDLKPLRYHTYSSDEEDGDEDEEDDFLGVEDLDERNKVKAVEAGDADGHADDSEGRLGGDVRGKKLMKSDEVDSGETHGADTHSEDEAEQNFNDHVASSDSDDDMDDDAMLLQDAGIVEILKQQKDTAFSQLLIFKSRVLSLLEIFLQKHPGKSQVLMIYSYLVRAFVKYNSARKYQASQKNQLMQLGLRIKGILQKKIFKAKDYPKGDDISLASLEPLLEKSLRSASRSSVKEMSSLAEASAFWLLKIIQSRNFDKSELERVVKLFQHTFIDYFGSRKCLLKSGFFKEVIRRHPWIGHELFGFLLEKCQVTKSEFRKIEALEVVDCIMKSWTPSTKGEDASSKPSSKLLRKHLPALCELIQVLLSQLPEKQSRRAEVRRFCTRALNAIAVLNLKKPFLRALKPDAYSLCESHLGNSFLPFKTPSQ